MTTFGEFKKKVIRMKGDTLALGDDEQPVVPVAGASLSAELLLDACVAALKAITTRQWKSAIFEISEEGDAFELPLDLIEIDAVLDNTLGMFIPKMVFTIGVEQVSLALEGNAWIDTPQGSITFTNGLKAAGAKVYYSADWSQPTVDDDVSGGSIDDAVLEAPEFCLTAMTLYATSYCYLASAALQAKLGGFKTRVDSGSPEDIPDLRMSEALLRRFENEMTRVPMKQKGTQ